MLYQLSYASTRAFYFFIIFTDPGAGDGARTRDIKLGRLALYQLSYSRDFSFPLDPPDESHGGGRIRTFEGVSRQIYSLLPLAAWVPHRFRASARPPFPFAHALGARQQPVCLVRELTVGIEPTTAGLQNRSSAD